MSYFLDSSFILNSRQYTPSFGEADNTPETNHVATEMGLVEKNWF